MTTLYIAGPMTGLPEFNYPAFKAAASMLHDRGYDVLCPTDIDALHNPDPSTPQDWEWYMRHALRMVLDADGLAMLDGWRASRGATLEAMVAKSLGLECLPVDYWVKVAA